MNSPIDLQYLKDAVEAVMGGEPMAEDTYEGLLAALAEVERLRDLAYPAPLPLSEASGDGPTMLWWRSAPIEEPPCYIGHPGDSGWPFTADDDPIWIPMPTLSADRPKVTP